MALAGESLTTPVVLLLFNRPALTQQVVNAVVQQNPESVYLIADGPRDDHPSDVELCDRVRGIALNAPWSGRVHTNFAETNIGLKNRVSSGLDWVFSTEDEAIILEDDCLPDPSFFSFANELLDRYRDDNRVGIVSGNNFLWGSQISDDSYFFTPDTRIWGWATWGRVWREFSDQGLRHLWTKTEVQNLTRRIQSPIRRRAIRRIHAGSSLNSWALPFTLHCLDRGLLNACPRTNLVTNLGFGTLSTHTAFESFTADVPISALNFPLVHPNQVVAPARAGSLETLAHRRRWMTFPLVHPFDFLGRLLRYARKKLS